jgi:hypothetical protein
MSRLYGFANPKTGNTTQAEQTEHQQEPVRWWWRAGRAGVSLPARNSLLRAPECGARTIPPPPPNPHQLPNNQHTKEQRTKAEESAA